MRNTILVVDDDRIFIETTKSLLESYGYSVLTASNGQEGFQIAKQQAPDVIILDMMMSYKDEGAEIAKALGSDAALKDIPVVFVTSMNKEEFKQIVQREVKENEVLFKPVVNDALLKIIADHVSHKGKEHRELVKLLNEFCERWKDKPGNLIMILHQVQNHYGYVPRDVSFHLCRILKIPLARIYEVITFYNYFKIDPPGKNTVSVCMGTACYLKGSPQILEELKHILKINEDETTKDGLFHLQFVRCVGCCGLAPVMVVNGKVYGKVKKEEVMHILSEYSAG